MLIKTQSVTLFSTIASKIIYTCAVLHNMCIAHDVPMREENFNELELDFGIHNNRNYNEYEENNIPVRNIRRVNPDLAAGRIVQRRIVDHYFY